MQPANDRPQHNARRVDLEYAVRVVNARHQAGKTLAAWRARHPVRATFSVQTERCATGRRKPIAAGPMTGTWSSPWSETAAGPRFHGAAR